MAGSKCRPIYLTIRALVDPETGERVGCLVPSHDVDKRLLRERKYGIGSEVRAELKKPRNAAFHRLVHAFGLMLSEHMPEFLGLQAHEAVKKAQALAGVQCESIEYDLPGIGKLMRTEPRSISFDTMDEADFKALFDAIVNHVTNMPGWIDVPHEVKDDLSQMVGDTFG